MQPLVIKCIADLSPETAAGCRVSPSWATKELHKLKVLANLLSVHLILLLIWCF